MLLFFDVDADRALKSIGVIYVDVESNSCVEVGLQFQEVKLPMK